MTSARQLDAPPSQLPAATSGTPGGSHRCGCVGHLSMWRQRCLMPAVGSPVSAMSTVTPKAKPSVSSVATPSFMLRSGGRALHGGAWRRAGRRRRRRRTRSGRGRRRFRRLH
eukprot:scaffold69137_cov115-Phaeocystis_antarctica.AAC.1